MQRCLSGLRSTIGNRVLRERNRRFKSSSLRQKTRTPFEGACFFCVEKSLLKHRKHGGSREENGKMAKR